MSFEPVVVAGTLDSTLNVFANGVNAPPATAALFGETLLPNGTLSVGNGVYGAIIGNTSPAQTLTFTNTTGLAITLGNPAVSFSGAGAAQFKVVTGTGTTHAPVGTLTAIAAFPATLSGATATAKSTTYTNAATVQEVLGATPVTFSGANATSFAVAAGTGTTCTANKVLAPGATCTN